MKLTITAFALCASALLTSGQTPVSLRNRNGINSTYYLKAHPRIWLDGPNGPISKAVLDPDGDGPLRSPKATGFYWNGLRSALASYRSKYWIITPTSISTQPYYTQNGEDLLYLALAYAMDHRGSYSGIPCPDSKLNNPAADPTLDCYKNHALYFVRNFDDISAPIGACDNYTVNCGRASVAPFSHPDYMRGHAMAFSQAYTLMREILSNAERMTFTRQMVNGMSIDLMPECDTRQRDLTGTMTYQRVAGQSYKITVTGTGTRFTQELSPNQWIFLKAITSLQGSGQWAKVLSIASNTVLTAQIGTELNSTWSKPGSLQVLVGQKTNPWTNNSCGWGYVTAHHGATPGYISVHNNVKSASAITPTSTTITLQSIEGLPGTDGIPSYLPWEMRLGSAYTGEVVRVTAFNPAAKTVTVERGLYQATPQSWPAGSTLIYMTHSASTDETGAGWHNLALTAQTAQIMTAIAFSEEDPRLLTVLEKTTNQFQEAMEVYRRYTSSIGTGMARYGYSRVLPFIAYSTGALLNSTLNAQGKSLDFRSPWMKRSYSLLYFFLQPAWAPLEIPELGDPAGGCENMNGASDAHCGVNGTWLNLFYPGSQEQKWSINWFRTMGIETRVPETGWRGLVPSILFLDSNTPTADHRTAIPPHLVNQTDDDGADKDTNLGVVFSRSDWTTQATQLYLMAFDSGLKGSSESVSDKLADIVPGDYWIGKLGSFLLGYRPGYKNAFGAGMPSLNVTDYNDVMYGAYTIRPGANIDRTLADDVTNKFLATRVDMNECQDPRSNLVRNYRYLVHFKSSPEHVLVFDDVALSAPGRIRTNLQYPLVGSTVVSADGKRVVTQSPQAKLVSSIVFGGSQRSNLSVSCAAGNVCTVGPLCAPGRPCIYSDPTRSRQWTAPLGTVRATTTASGSWSAWLYMNTATGAVTAQPSVAGATLACTGSISCNNAPATAFPAGVYKLARLRWNNASGYTVCPGITSINGGLEYHNCSGDTGVTHFVADPSSTASQFLVDHAVGALATTAADPVSELATVSSNWRGGQVQASAGWSKVVVFPIGGDRPGVSFTSTHAGSGQYMIAGLASGAYTVSRGGQTVLANRTVTTENGMLYWEGPSGAYMVARSGSPLPSFMELNDTMSLSSAATSSSKPSSSKGVAIPEGENRALAASNSVRKTQAPEQVQECRGSALRTAAWLTAEAYHWKVAGSQPAGDHLRLALQTLNRLTGVTGTDAVADCAVPFNSPLVPELARDLGMSALRTTSEEGVPWTWVGPVDERQYAAIFFGLASTWDLVEDDEVRGEVRALALRLIPAWFARQKAPVQPVADTTALHALSLGLRVDPERFGPALDEAAALYRRQTPAVEKNPLLLLIDHALLGSEEARNTVIVQRLAESQEGIDYLLPYWMGRFHSLVE